jgi:hypothetical protein
MDRNIQRINRIIQDSVNEQIELYHKHLAKKLNIPKATLDEYYDNYLNPVKVTCAHVFTKGKMKGQTCKVKIGSGRFCSKHKKDDQKDDETLMKLDLQQIEDPEWDTDLSENSD